MAWEAWTLTIRRLAAHSRGELISDLSEVVPVIAAFGGSAAAGEAFHALQDAYRWWS